MTIFLSQPDTYPSKHHWQLPLLDPSWQGDNTHLPSSVRLVRKTASWSGHRNEDFEKSSLRALWAREWWAVPNERCLGACALCTHYFQPGQSQSDRSCISQSSCLQTTAFIHQKENIDVIWRISTWSEILYEGFTTWMTTRLYHWAMPRKTLPIQPGCKPQEERLLHLKAGSPGPPTRTSLHWASIL